MHKRQPALPFIFLWSRWPCSSSLRDSLETHGFQRSKNRCLLPRGTSPFPDPLAPIPCASSSKRNAAYAAFRLLSRWPGLNRRPRPSLKPLLLACVQRARLYLHPQGMPLSVVRAISRHGLTWHEALTVIRDSPADRSVGGQGLRPTMDALYQLSYIGVVEPSHPSGLPLFFQSAQPFEGRLVLRCILSLYPLTLPYGRQRLQVQPP